MFDDVWKRIVQHHYQNRAAVLSGYKRLSVKGDNYPGLVKSFNSTVEGLVYLDVRAQDIKRLDRFEGDYYKRVPVTVSSDNGCYLDVEVYLFSQRHRHLLGNTSWDPVKFRAHYLRRFITKYRGFN